MFVRLRQSSAVVRSAVREAFLSSHRSSAPIPDFLATSTLPRRRCFSGSREGQVGFIGLGNMGEVTVGPVISAKIKFSISRVAEILMMGVAAAIGVLFK